MKQTYKEIMDNVKVTPEMRRRVLDNVQARMEQQELSLIHISEPTRP